jgi:hypothetical protein
LIESVVKMLVAGSNLRIAKTPTALVTLLMKLVPTV